MTPAEAREGWLEKATPTHFVAMLRQVATDKQGNDTAMSVAKGALFALGAIAAIGIGIAALKLVLPLALLGGAGYLGYRLIAKPKALSEGSARRAIGSSDDFDRRMAELDAVEKKLDAEIRRGS